MIIACQSKMSQKEYVHFVQNKDNGFIQKANYNESHKAVSLMLMPAEYLCIIWSNRFQVQTKLFKDCVQENKANQYFQLIIPESEKSDKDSIVITDCVLSSGSGGSNTEASSITEESTSGITPFRSFIIIFPIAEEKIKSNINISMAINNRNFSFDFPYKQIMRHKNKLELM